MDRAILKTSLIILASLGLAFLFNFLFFEKQIGISVLIFNIILLATVFLLESRRRTQFKKTWWLVLAILFFTLMVGIRANELLTFLNVCAAFGLLVLLANELIGIPAPLMKLRDYLIFVFLAPLRMLGRALSIISLIGQIRSLRKERDEMTAEVKKLKEEKAKLQEELKNKEAKKEEMQKKRKEIMQEFHLRYGPEEIKSQMERLESKIETEAIPFEKEKELMKKINELKKRYVQASKLTEEIKGYKDLTHDIGELRTKVQETFLHVQAKASQGQQRHEKMMALIKELDAMKTQGQFTPEIEAANKEMDELRKKLEEELGELQEISKEAGVQEEISRQNKSRKMDEMAEKVEEKLRTKKKLTTEDLLMYQAGRR